MGSNGEDGRVRLRILGEGKAEELKEENSNGEEAWRQAREPFLKGC